MEFILPEHRRYRPLVLCGPYDALSEWSARFMMEALYLERQKRGWAAWGSSTGSTPEGTYAWLERLKGSKKGVDAGDWVVQQDNYRLPLLDPMGYDTEVGSVCDRLGIPRDRLLVPPSVGNVQEIRRACSRFDQKRAIHRIIVQFLGLGPNGHIGFNEPGRTTASAARSFLRTGTRLVQLADETLVANSRFFGNDVSKVPKQAITRGWKSYEATGWHLIMANSETKAMAAWSAIHGAVCCECPASFLQLHPRVIWLICDKASGPFQDPSVLTHLLPDVGDVLKHDSVFNYHCVA